MKRIAAIIAAMLALAAPQLYAQIEEPAENDIRGRLSLSVEKDLPHGFDLYATQEFRASNRFKSFDRFMTVAGVSYKPVKYVKFGLSYTLFSINDGIPEGGDSRVWEFKHRVAFDVTGMYKAGPWRFSLREKVQATLRTDDFNHYQSPATDVVLRSRLKASYKARRVPLEPYVSVEPYVRLNAVNPSSLATSSEDVRMDVRYNQAYLSRVRSMAGFEWTLNSRNSFDFYFMGDAWFDRKIDATRNGVLKSKMVVEDGEYVKRQAVYYRHGFNSILGVAYTFSF